MTYRISKRADRDLREILDYIARDSVETADRVDREFHAEFQKLAEMPGMGHRRADVKSKRYWFSSLYNYVIAYRIEKGILIVIRVVHGARDFKRLFRSR